MGKLKSNYHLIEDNEGYSISFIIEKNSIIRSETYSRKWNNCLERYTTGYINAQSEFKNLKQQWENKVE